MLKTLQGDKTEVQYSKLIFDDIYKNSYERDMITSNEKFFYFKTLYRIKNKLRQQRNDHVIGDVFNQHLEAKRISIPPEPRKIDVLQNHNYQIQKINNKLFKINKAPPVTNDKKEVSSEKRPQSHNISFRTDLGGELQINVRTKLQDIVNRHRSLQRKYKMKKLDNTIDALPKEYRSLDARGRPIILNTTRH